MSRGILVTGASRGVGAATARRFAADGDRVVVHYHSGREAAETVLAELPGKGHGICGADLADPAACADLASYAIGQLGRVDVLVNNAALVDDAAPAGSRRVGHRLDETSYEDWTAIWQRTLATNLMGPANLAWHVARHMIEVEPADGAPRGRIVNVGSRGAYRGEPDIPAYGASKAGLHSLGQSLAASLGGHGISVVSVAPGFIATAMSAEALAGPGGEAIRAQSPFGRVATAEEVAEAIHTFAAPDAEWFSGAVVDLNGASHLR